MDGIEKDIVDAPKEKSTDIIPDVMLSFPQPTEVC